MLDIMLHFTPLLDEEMLCILLQEAKICCQNAKIYIYGNNNEVLICENYWIFNLHSIL